MATNSYFSSNFAGVPEQTLVEDLIIEAIQIHGLDCVYIPRDLVAHDTLFDEDKLSSFSRTYTIELYIKSIDGFGGDRDFLSKFGLEIRDEINFTISRKRFEEEVVANEGDIIRPREGDLIFFPLNKRVFEITFAEDEEVFHELGKLYTYELRCKVFELASETFDTGDADIDKLDDFKQNTKLVLGTGTGDYTVDEIVGNGDLSIQATVVSWDNGDNTLIVKDVLGEIQDAIPLVGQTSGASYGDTVVQSETFVDPISDSDFITSKTSDILDFSESNPFSE